MHSLCFRSRAGQWVSHGESVLDPSGDGSRLSRVTRKSVQKETPEAEWSRWFVDRLLPFHPADLLMEAESGTGKIGICHTAGRVMVRLTTSPHALQAALRVYSISIHLGKLGRSPVRHGPTSWMGFVQPRLVPYYRDLLQSWSL